MTGGFFVTVDSPSGVGKSTTIAALQRLLASQGVDALLTTEPPKTALGNFTRHNASNLRGLTLACMVAAARYEHVDTTVTPAMNGGRLLISDRYIASTLVLQRLDGVPLEFLLDINQHAPSPDSAVILTAGPATIAERIATAGVTHRFRSDPDGPAREVCLYGEAAAVLEGRGVDVLRVDSSIATPSEVARRIADAITARRLPSVPSQVLPTSRES
ncbi:dTMP kinase [Streptomyces sp. NPDC005349]|uniref:dTMP kinase n=1 Tax=Streptomyces sp. NPDC005349 TaxID=3157037 RepID=UPI0033B7C0AF